MASSKSLDIEQLDLKSSIHQVHLSIGHLKFSLKSLLSLQVQNATLPGKKESNDDSKASFKLPSNEILEKIINSIASLPLEKKCLQNEDVLNNLKVEDTQKKSVLTVGELELVYKNLLSELERAVAVYRTLIQGAMSK